MSVPIAEPDSITVQLDAANATVSSDPTKAEELYRGVLSRKAGEWCCYSPFDSLEGGMHVAVLSLP